MAKLISFGLVNRIKKTNTDKEMAIVANLLEITTT